MIRLLVILAGLGPYTPQLNSVEHAPSYDEQVRQTLETRGKELRDCAKTANGRHTARTGLARPDGVSELVLVIDAQGTAKDTRVKRQSTDYLMIGACLQRELSELKFPAPPKGKPQERVFVHETTCRSEPVGELTAFTCEGTWSLAAAPK